MAFVWRKPTRTLLISWVISFACPTAFAQVIPACYIKNSKEVIERACSDFDREEGKLKSNKQLTAAKTSCKLFYGSLVLATEHYCDYQNNTVLAAEASKSSAEKEGADSKTSQERVAALHGRLKKLHEDYLSLMETDQNRISAYHHNLIQNLRWFLKINKTNFVNERNCTVSSRSRIHHDTPAVIGTALVLQVGPKSSQDLDDFFSSLTKIREKVQQQANTSLEHFQSSAGRAEQTGTAGLEAALKPGNDTALTLPEEVELPESLRSASEVAVKTAGVFTIRVAGELIAHKVLKGFTRAGAFTCILVIAEQASTELALKAFTHKHLSTSDFVAVAASIAGGPWTGAAVALGIELFRNEAHRSQTYWNFALKTVAEDPNVSPKALNEKFCDTPEGKNAWTIR